MGRHADESDGSASAVGASDPDTIVLARPSTQIVLARPGAEVALWREVEETLRPYLPAHRRRSPLAVLTAVRWRWPLALAAVVTLLVTPLAVTLAMTGGPSSRDRAGATSSRQALEPTTIEGPSRSDVAASRSGQRQPVAEVPPVASATPSAGPASPSSDASLAPAAPPEPAASASPSARTEAAVPLLAPGRCIASYSPWRHWPGGYSGTLDVSNETGAPINGWTLTWRSSATVDWVWGGTASQDGDLVTVGDASWNRTIPVGETVRVEFMITGVNDGETQPAEVTLNGAACRFTVAKE